MKKHLMCPFCKKNANFDDVPNIHQLYIFDCSEVCGSFYIEHFAFEKAKGPLGSLHLHAIQENIKANEFKTTPYWAMKSQDRVDNLLKSLPENVIPKYLGDYENVSIQHSQKPNELLLFMGAQMKDYPPFDRFIFKEKDYLRFKIKDRGELLQWMGVLENKYFVSNHNSTLSAGVLSYALTPMGWAEIESLHRSLRSNKVFLAMKFSDNPDRVEIQTALERACKETGWEASTIDSHEFLGGISDEIIARINQSAFIIADFTGQNHGVYYEAGYAAGMGKMVILTVKEADVKALHFDTKHLNHITWKDSDDLFSKVKTRINALLNK